MPHQLRLIAAADAILAQTELEADYLRSRGIPAERIVLAGVGVNPSEVLGGVAARFREATGIEAPFVAYVGTCAYDKGTNHLVDAMRRLWDERPGAGTAPDLVLAGPVLDAFRAHLAAIPEANRARVHLLGVIGEELKRDLFDAATVFAMPSRTDSFGIVYLEAWLYGKPVIGARAGGVPAVIEDGRDGYLVEFGDVESLARRIAELASDPGLARRLGKRGQAKVLERFTWDRIYPVVEGVYDRLCPRTMAN